MHSTRACRVLPPEGEKLRKPANTTLVTVSTLLADKVRCSPNAARWIRTRSRISFAGLIGLIGFPGGALGLFQPTGPLSGGIHPPATYYILKFASTPFCRGCLG